MPFDPQSQEFQSRLSALPIIEKMIPKNQAIYGKYPGAFVVFNQMISCPDPLTTAEIAKKIGCFVDITSTKLCYLARLGKIKRMPGGRWLICEYDFTNKES